MSETMEERVKGFDEAGYDEPREIVDNDRSELKKIVGNTLHKNMAITDWDKCVEHIVEDVLEYIDDYVIHLKNRI